MTNNQNNMNGSRVDRHAEGRAEDRHVGMKVPGGTPAPVPGRKSDVARSAAMGQAKAADAGSARSAVGSAKGFRPAAEGGSKKRTAIIVVGIIVAALAIWLLVWLFACNGSSLFDSNAQTGQAPYKTDEEMQAELDRTVEEGMFNISIASVIEFENGAAEGTAYIENVPSNPYNMKVTITEDATGDVLYESGILQPNQFIENITLTRDLDAGTYPATATFSAIDKTTYEEIGQAAAKVTLNVLN